MNLWQSVFLQIVICLHYNIKAVIKAKESQPDINIYAYCEIYQKLYKSSIAIEIAEPRKIDVA